MREGGFSSIGLVRLRQAEIQHLHLVVTRQHDVSRFEIAMNNPALMRRFEGFSNLFCDGKCLLDRNGPCLQPLLQRSAFGGPLQDALRFLGFRRPVDVGVVRLLAGADNWASSWKRLPWVGIRGYDSG